MEKLTQIIKDKLSVVEVLKQYIELIPAGKSFKAKCPFHNEKTPSFVVSLERGSWHCFGCDEGGDIFTFVQKYENVEFFEALRILAEKAGVEVRRESVEQQRQFGVLYDINELAVKFYIENLKKNIGAQEYLKKRGLKGETAKIFRVGTTDFSSNWDDLTTFLMKQGFSVQNLERSGLVVRNEGRGTYYDRFRDRIMFPLFNHAGKVVGFSGRIRPGGDETMGKYINSPETPIFSKSKILFGFYQAKHFIREENRALVVEGQMDVLMGYQAGFKAIVATSGTALTENHLISLSRLTDRIIFSFDSDEAGQRAAERALDMTLTKDLAISLLKLDGYKDIAELVLDKPDGLADISLNLSSASDFYFNRYLVGESSYEKKRGIKEILKKILLRPSAIDREEWINELSSRVSIVSEALKEELRYLEKDVFKEQNNKVKEEDEKNISRLDMLSLQILLAGVHYNDLKSAQKFELYMPLKYKDILKALLEGGLKDDTLDIHFKSALYKGESIDLVGCQLKIEYLRDKKQELLLKIKKAEQISDGSVAKLIDDFQKVSLELEKTLNNGL
ncbi:MAG: DNA primase [Candidatus Liptonbacteria bacterium CG11_big_fil_rev_8_21_14_0_20_35_14]|uniref:DNA primase n=1 Tax=Candidatus Liptonbacteria bacterium CG11_big_fil_rev_8_21_14_0_20_35_14 TaxID=1974634 RepID=A0A2H0N7N9_9BACT|nr:MAG: DNA primase [Candidatus Liptonbacteria bacterium CG11_big_fil_rev_8_21_14_0_20_35_14]